MAAHILVALFATGWAFDTKAALHYFPNRDTTPTIVTYVTSKKAEQAVQRLLAGVALEDTPSVGTGRRLPSVGRLSQPEGFDSPVLHTTVQLI